MNSGAEERNSPCLRQWWILQHESALGEKPRDADDDHLALVGRRLRDLRDDEIGQQLRPQPAYNQ